MNQHQDEWPQTSNWVTPTIVCRTPLFDLEIYQGDRRLPIEIRADRYVVVIEPQPFQIRVPKQRLSLEEPFVSIAASVDPKFFDKLCPPTLVFGSGQASDNDKDQRIYTGDGERLSEKNLTLGCHIFYPERWCDIGEMVELRVQSIFSPCEAPLVHKDCLSLDGTTIYFALYVTDRSGVGQAIGLTFAARLQLDIQATSSKRFSSEIAKQAKGRHLPQSENACILDGDLGRGGTAKSPTPTALSQALIEAKGSVEKITKGLATIYATLDIVAAVGNITAREILESVTLFTSREGRVWRASRKCRIFAHHNARQKHLLTERLLSVLESAQASDDVSGCLANLSDLVASMSINGTDLGCATKFSSAVQLHLSKCGRSGLAARIVDYRSITDRTSSALGWRGSTKWRFRRRVELIESDILSFYLPLGFEPSEPQAEKVRAAYQNTYSEIREHAPKFLQRAMAMELGKSDWNEILIANLLKQCDETRYNAVMLRAARMLSEDQA